MDAVTFIIISGILIGLPPMIVGAYFYVKCKNESECLEEKAKSY